MFQTLASRIIFLTCLALLAGTVQAADQRKELSRNILLMEGNYDGGAGTFDLPQPLEEMPIANWFVLEKSASGTVLKKVDASQNTRPDFLQRFMAATEEAPSSSGPEGVEKYYLHIPAASLTAGDVTEVPLKRRALTPILGHEYSLTMNGKPFKMTARNGLKGVDGAYYVVEVDGVSYEYLLPGYGWDHSIQFAGDIDRDGKPDFIINVNASNSGATYVLFSSQAKPGKNLPTAVRWSFGC